MSHVRHLWSEKLPLDICRLPMLTGAETQIIQRPDEYRFLHDCMITAYHGKLYTAWYNCPTHEMADRSVIRGRVSPDEGKTWSDIIMMADDHASGLIYVPPAFGICPKDGNLYLFATRMTGPDIVQDCEIFRLEDESANEWRSVRILPDPFLPNTPVYQLPNGKLIMAGRVAPKTNSLPEIPAVAISDSGRIDAEWRIVRIDNRIKAPEGENWFPETCLIIDGEKIEAFVRHDRHYPLMYESLDSGETWSEPLVHDVPVGASKLFVGTLSDGRIYLISNLADQARETLALFLSAPGEKTFSSAALLRNGEDHLLDARPQWSYPAAVEFNGSLWVVCTSEKTSAALIRVPLN